MRLSHLHALGGDAPLGGVEINVVPFGGNEFNRPEEYERGEPQSHSQGSLRIDAIDRSSWPSRRGSVIPAWCSVGTRSSSPARSRVMSRSAAPRPAA
jgi:hypothetical protein